ncbi:helix-turn-helix transcriptional regulator [Thalassospiraceae bacterium LMO-JJ14]|nr:helix-turn-helix transcriptional regulator [Thalassospiraceae bacterium LMO-JJ14]
MPSPLGVRIKELRKSKKFTLEQLAERIGSSKGYVWELENKDDIRPSAEKLDKIAVTLDTTSEFLLTGKDADSAVEEDKAFFRKYQEMPPETKEKIRRMLHIWDSDD